MSYKLGSFQSTSSTLVFSGVLFLILFSGISISEASVSTAEVERGSTSSSFHIVRNHKFQKKIQNLSDAEISEIKKICVSRAEIREARKEMYKAHRLAKKEFYKELREKIKNKEITLSELFQLRKSFTQSQREIRKEFLEVSKKIKRGGVKEMKSFFKNQQSGKKLQKFLPALGFKRAVKVCKFVKK